MIQERVFVRIKGKGKYDICHTVDYMKKYKILFSIPVHERLDVIVDQIININYFNPNCAIVLHFSQAYKQDEDTSLEYSEFEKIVHKIGNIYINPKRMRTSWGNILHCHIFNFMYAKSVILFEYFVPMASNELFIKNGMYEYISKYDFGGDFFDVKKRIEPWNNKEPAMKDKQLQSMIESLGGTTIWGGQIEGSFFRYDIMDEVTKILFEFYDYEKDEGLYVKEEIYIASVVCNIRRQGRWLHKNLTYIDWKHELRINILKIKKAIKMENIYAIKRIERKMYDPNRVYVRQYVGKYIERENLFLPVKRTNFINIIFFQIVDYVNLIIKKIIDFLIRLIKKSGRR